MRVQIPYDYRKKPGRILRAVLHQNRMYFSLESGGVGVLGEDGVIRPAPEYSDLKLLEISYWWAHPVFTGDEVRITF